MLTGEMTSIRAEIGMRDVSGGDVDPRLVHTLVENVDQDFDTQNHFMYITNATLLSDVSGGVDIGFSVKPIYRVVDAPFGFGELSSIPDELYSTTDASKVKEVTPGSSEKVVNFSADTPTSIAQAEKSDVTIIGGTGVIYIKGETQSMVYNLQGMLIKQGTDAEINVSPGLYIVRTASKTEKVAVK